MNKKTILFLCIISLLSLFINLYKKSSSPPCFSTDEAAFGYNAYSLLKTARDEYGTLLPLRLKSFGDYKMPLYSYLSIPFIATGGLNEVSTRSLNTTISIIFPIIIFLLTKELLKKNNIAFLASFLFTLSLGIQTIGRQAHEAYLTTFFLVLTLWLLFISMRIKSFILKILFFISLTLFSFGYQFSRLWLVLIFALICYFAINKLVSRRFLLASIVVFLLLAIPDLLVKPARVNNLLFFNNPGLGMQTAELRSEGGTRLVYNKLTIGLKNLIFNHLSYYSPQFLVNQGDDNWRFGYPSMSPITAIEYIFLFIGAYYLFKDKQRLRLIIIVLFLFAPVSASLSWAGYSITRSLPLIVIVNILSAYGFIRLLESLPVNYRPKLIGALISVGYLIFCFYSWDFYYNHYPKRAQTIRAWQCGNKQLVAFIKENDQADRFYITKKNGQPYIFILFYLNYPPAKYQKLAKLSPADEFGFGQVEKFDKFVFDIKIPKNKEKAFVIGYPDDFNNISSNIYTKIKIKTEEVFWIYKNFN